MRPASILATSLLAAAGAIALADAAAAQSAPRQLTWAGRPEVSAAVAAAVPISASAGRPRRPNPVIPHGGAAAVEAAPFAPSEAAPPRRTLTPANAWLQPRQPQPEPAPAPVQPAVMAAAPPVQPQPRPQPRATPDFLPDQGGRGQPVPADIALAMPTPQPEAQPGPPQPDPSDPMAPRRDAPIFRMQREQPAPPPEPQAAAPAVAPARADAEARTPQPRRVAEVTRTEERPAPWTGARYYSLHRQNGRQPDPLALPQPTYVDALAVTMTETPASQDLAQPDQGPTLIRDNQGRLRAAPAPSDGDHQ